MLGDPAPAIQVAEWVQGTPVTAFEHGQTYVVEFWATWCGPCKVAIPHLSQLSKQYAGKVQFIGVSVSESIGEDQPYRVPRFVQEMGDKMSYTVAADRVKANDPHRMNESWMHAAGQGGIPTAFIVNGAGKIAWIGHPMAMDSVLSQVVDGTWDLDKAAREYAAEMQMKSVASKLNREISKAKKERDYAAALRVLDHALGQEPKLETSFGLEKYFLLLEVQRAADAATYGRRLVSEVIASNPMALNQLAWTIVDPQGKWKTGDYELATRAAERAVELVEGKDASTLDTLGLALFKLGQVARAIEIQQKAVELAQGQGPLEEELRGRLEEFQRAQQSL